MSLLDKLRKFEVLIALAKENFVRLEDLIEKEMYLEVLVQLEKYQRWNMRNKIDMEELRKTIEKMKASTTPETPLTDDSLSLLTVYLESREDLSNRVERLAALFDSKMEASDD